MKSRFVTDTVKGGFTLIEVLVVTLVMGLSITGLLNLFNMGQRRYAALTLSWKYREATGKVRRHIRNLIAEGGILQAAPTVSDIRKFLPSGAGIGISDISFKDYPPGAVFVRAGFFADENLNGIREPKEEATSVLWCFRTRTDR